MTEKQLANLRPAKPGEIRNPLGINRKRPYTERYSIRAESPFPESLRLKFNEELGEEVLPKGATWADAAVLRRNIEAIMVGGTPAAKEIVDRIEGKSATFEDEKVDAKEAHVYLIVAEDKRIENAKPVIGNLEITGGSHARSVNRKSR